MSMDNINYDEIYNKIMLILIGNEGKVYNEFTLCDLVYKKITNITYLSPEFKYRFRLMISQLSLKNDDIKITKKDNIYYIVYNLSQNELEGNINETFIPNIQENQLWIDNNEFNNYLLNYSNYKDYRDPVDGNTFYHNVLKSADPNILKTLINSNIMNYNVKNVNNQTPLECINNINVAAIIINDLNVNINNLKTKLKDLEVKIINKDDELFKLKLNVTNSNSYSTFFSKYIFTYLLLTSIFVIIRTIFNF